MRHYEIMLLIHPDQGKQVQAMIQRYTALIQNAGGVIHRLEDLGQRSLAYSIKNLRKAFYVLMNIECDEATRDKLSDNFYYNDAVLRPLILQQRRAITEPSPLAKATQGPETDNKRAHQQVAINETDSTPDKA